MLIIGIILLCLVIFVFQGSAPFVSFLLLLAFAGFIGIAVAVVHVAKGKRYVNSIIIPAEVWKGKRITFQHPVYHPKAFEAQMAEMFRIYGYTVKETPYQGDHGIDLKLFKDNEFGIVQCKRHTGPIGEPVIRDFFGCMQHEGADYGIVITTSRFTQKAKEWARGKKIMLVDQIELENMLQETQRMRGMG